MFELQTWFLTHSIFPWEYEQRNMMKVSFWTNHDRSYFQNAKLEGVSNRTIDKV